MVAERQRLVAKRSGKFYQEESVKARSRLPVGLSLARREEKYSLEAVLMSWRTYRPGIAVTAIKKKKKNKTQKNRGNVS